MELIYEEALRLECLRLAVAINTGNPVWVADEMYRFITEMRHDLDQKEGVDPA